MTVERITKELNLETGDRLFILYGLNTKDNFCTQKLILQNIKEALHQHLQEQGYERILFYDNTKKLYFLDEKSRDGCLLRPRTQNVSNKNKPMTLKSGPLGSKSLNIKTQESTNQPTSPTETNTRLQDIQILPIFEQIIRDKTVKSAIIFPLAQYLGAFSNTVELYGRIEEWLHLSPDNHNLCIFIFHHDNRVDLKDFCKSIGFSLLENILGDENKNQSNIVRIGAPYAQEIMSLRDYFRLEKNKTIEWKTTEKISAWMAAENCKLERWYSRFNKIEHISLTEAKSQKWFSDSMNLNEITKEKLEDYLHRRIIGQRKAIERISDLTDGQIEANYSLPLVLLLPGPTGTGKTELSKALADALNTKLNRFNMGEYMDKHNASNLLGSPLGYKDSDLGGKLPNTLRENPQICVILFDEAEKAHESLWQRLLAFFDEGIVADTKGEVIAPKNTICIFTTNLESEKIEKDPKDAQEILRNSRNSQNSRYFSPEFLGRVDEFIPMRRLNEEELFKLTVVTAERLAKQYGIDLTIDQDQQINIIPLIRDEAYHAGGRGIKRKLRSLLLEDLIKLKRNGITKAKLENLALVNQD